MQQEIQELKEQQVKVQARVDALQERVTLAIASLKSQNEQLQRFIEENNVLSADDLQSLTEIKAANDAIIADLDSTLEN